MCYEQGTCKGTLLAMDYAVSFERDKEPVKRNLGIRRVLTNEKCAI